MGVKVTLLLGNNESVFKLTADLKYEEKFTDIKYIEISKCFVRMVARRRRLRHTMYMDIIGKMTRSPQVTV